MNFNMTEKVSMNIGNVFEVFQTILYKNDRSYINHLAYKNSIGRKRII